MLKSKNAGLSLVLALVFFLVSLGVSFSQTSVPAKAKIDINTATSQELESLPRIGPKIAQRIIEFRTQNGNFRKIEDIMKVKGIGQKLFEQIKDRIVVSQEKPAK